MHRVSFRDAKKMSKPIKIAFLSKAGERIPIRDTEKMTKPVKISFLSKRVPRRKA